MYYVTTFQKPRTHQLDMEELWENEIDVSMFANAPTTITATVTKTFDEIPERITRTVNAGYLIFVLRRFVTSKQDLYAVQNRHELYDTFQIPKKSGGLRTINAPVPRLMEALRELKTIFETDFHALYHTSAYAYIPHRSTIDSVKRHQKNESWWFLKTDFHDFFGSTTKDFILKQFGMIFPFCLVLENAEGRRLMEQCIDLCMLDGGLPQGTPISPLITNVMMIPIDHTIANELHKHGYIYTRYADDSLISHKCSFDYNRQVAYINSVLKRFEAPFQLKSEKTRYGSRAGSNWNLGVMLNKNNEITIGYKNAQRFNAMCSNYIQDRKRGVMWDYESLSKFRGLISYYMMVEKDYITSTIAFYNQKYGVNMYTMLEEDLRNGGQQP